jgi:hypothetical protein
MLKTPFTLLFSCIKVKAFVGQIEYVLLSPVKKFQFEDFTPKPECPFKTAA